MISTALISSIINLRNTLTLPISSKYTRFQDISSIEVVKFVVTQTQLRNAIHIQAVPKILFNIIESKKGIEKSHRLIIIAYILNLIYVIYHANKTSVLSVIALE
jgi:hypothetical protein